MMQASGDNLIDLCKYVTICYSHFVTKLFFFPGIFITE